MIVAECYKEAALDQCLGLLLMPSVPILIVPMLCVGMHPLTLRVNAGRRASGAAFPHRAWERATRVNNPGAYETPIARRSR